MDEVGINVAYLKLWFTFIVVIKCKVFGTSGVASLLIFEKSLANYVFQPKIRKFSHLLVQPH